MRIDTKFSNGDVVWRAYTNYGPTSQVDCPECGGKGALTIEGKTYKFRCPGWHCRDGKIHSYGPTPLAETLTIGQVRLEISDSPGTNNDTFSNFGPVRKYEESYMAVETGVGSGSIYNVEDLFHTEAEALERAKFKVLEAIEYQRTERERQEKQDAQNRRQLTEELTEASDAGEHQ